MTVARLIPLDRPLLRMAIAVAADRSFIDHCDTQEFQERALGNASYALLVGGRLLGAGGVVVHWHGLAEGWLLPSSLCSRRDLVLATRAMRTWFDRLQAHPVFRRLEVRISAAASWRACWAKAIGFDAGQLLEAWGPDGSDHYLHARIVRGDN